MSIFVPNFTKNQFTNKVFAINNKEFTKSVLLHFSIFRLKKQCLVNTLNELLI